jgi:hypothetical protein
MTPPVVTSPSVTPLPVIPEPRPRTEEEILTPRK